MKYHDNSANIMGFHFCTLGGRGNDDPFFLSMSLIMTPFFCRFFLFAAHVVFPFHIQSPSPSNSPCTSLSSRAAGGAGTGDIVSTSGGGTGAHALGAVG